MINSMDFDFSLLSRFTSSAMAAGLFFIVIRFGYYSLTGKVFHFFGGVHVGNHPKPPEPGRAWPVLGHLHLLQGPKLLHEKLSEIADKHGPIYGIRLGLRPAIVVSSWELAKELSTIHDKVVAWRPRMIVAEHLGYNYAMVSFAPYGSYWRELRKFISLELLSTRRLDLLAHSRISETKASIQQLYTAWTDKRHHLPKNNGGVVVEMNQWVSDLTINVNFLMIFGRRYSDGDGSDKEEARKCQRIYRDYLHLIGLNVMGDMIPWLRWLDLGGHEKRMKEVSKEYDQLLEKWLDDHHDEEHSRKGSPDFMGVMISKLKDANIDGYDTSTIIKATCTILNITGTDTTASLIIWALCLLMNNRYALRKVEEELDVHVGKERNVEESDLSNLEYLQAVIKETLRLYPTGPLGAPREVTEDCVIGGFHVAARTRLFFNIWKLQRDPRIWDEPTKFRPERFMTTHANIDVRGQNFELIPFGIGRRICPGINFGLKMGQYVLARLLHSFEFTNIFDNEPIDMSATEGLSLSKAIPFEVIIAPRLPSHLYA